MVDFSYPHGASAGAAILANDHNNNWDYLKNFINGVSGDLGTYPGLLKENNPSATGNVTLGSSTAFYMNSGQQNVIGLATGTDINGETAGNWLFDNKYRAGVSGLSEMTDVTTPADQAGNYSTQKHRYSVYSKRAGEGQTTEVGRPASEYRLVINGSMAIRGDIIGYTNWNDDGTAPDDYILGEGTRINCQWANVRANIDCGGEIRVGSRFQTATLYFGDEYNTNQDYIQWKDNLPNSLLPGFQFVHNDTAHLTIAESAGVLDLRSQSGWPTLPGTGAVINVTSGQLAYTSSSIRFKEDVEDLDSEDNWTKLRALKPRTFCWNEEIATPGGLDYENQIPEPGFIAEEVHEVAPDHILYDAEGDPIMYRDTSMLAMLVKAVVRGQW